MNSLVPGIRIHLAGDIRMVYIANSLYSQVSSTQNVPFAEILFSIMKTNTEVKFISTMLETDGLSTHV